MLLELFFLTTAAAQLLHSLFQSPIVLEHRSIRNHYQWYNLLLRKCYKIFLKNDEKGLT